MGPIFFRADASTQMGTGHVMRCLALAQAWQDRGGRAVFVSAELPSALRDRLHAEGCGVEVIGDVPGGPEDSARTVALARELEAEWVVLDGYHLGGDFQQSLKDAGLRVLAVDDYGHAGRYPADLVLNQNLGADVKLYTDRSPQTRLLLGPEYVLLRREFTGAGWEREIPALARKVLVTLGGADPDNATRSVIEALSRVRSDGLESVIVIGPSNPHRTVLEAAVSVSSVRIDLQTNVSDMPALMRWADVSVTAGGSTSWERSRYGLPGLVMVLADNQEKIAAALEAGGLGWNLGWHDRVAKDELADALERLLRDGEARKAMAHRGQKLVDGRGAERVADIMTGVPRLRLRPAIPEDARMLWDWVNDPAVRRSAFCPEPIPWETHQTWLARRLGDPDCRIYIAEDDLGQPIGQIRFDRTSSSDADVDVSVRPDRRGHGNGEALIRGGVDKVFCARWVSRVNAYIKPENIASLRSFRKAEFALIGEVEYRGHRAIHAVRVSENG